MGRAAASILRTDREKGRDYPYIISCPPKLMAGVISAEEEDGKKTGGAGACSSLAPELNDLGRRIECKNENRPVDPDCSATVEGRKPNRSRSANWGRISARDGQPFSSMAGGLTALRTSKAGQAGRICLGIYPWRILRSGKAVERMKTSSSRR